MNTASEFAVYDGRHALGIVRPVGNRFEAITATGETLGLFNGAQAAANAVWEYAYRHVCGLEGGAA